MKQRAFWFVMLLLVLPALIVQQAGAISLEDVPPELSRWQAWVLHDHEHELCPGRFNDSVATRCQWPARLQLDITDDGASFEQGWDVYAPGWVALPGDEKVWPDGVTLDGDSVVVIAQNQVPAVFVPTGAHRIRGRFFWRQIPETLTLPAALGLLTLSRNGEPVEPLELMAPNKLWLGREEINPTEENQAKIKIFRLIRDTIPMQVVTLIRIDVFGESRELRLGGTLLKGSIPMALDSPLPARLNGENQLTLQARPGRWEVWIRSRLTGSRLRIAADPLPYGDEIWSFEPQHHLRMVEIQDLTRVEPSQTESPNAWRQFSAFVLSPGDEMTVKEIRRGNPDPPPDQLTLQRTWWLDFNGRGYTLHDKISGTLSRQWRLTLNPPAVLGRVAVNGRNQVLTTQNTEKEAGVELRAGRVVIEADARLDKSPGPIPVVGWDHDFQTVSGQLHLPPGWRLLAATGVDEVSDAWLQSWSLFDLFLVLIIALAIFKLRNWRWALAALMLMILIFQEPEAPRLVWLHLLAVLALLPLLPRGWIRRCVYLWGICALVVLVVQALPFAVNQIRWGIYPQLAPFDHQIDKRDIRMTFSKQADLAGMLSEPPAEQAPPAPMARQPRKGKRSSQSADFSSQPTSVSTVFLTHDPDALVPTGPGLPQWHWQIVGLTWSGPLTRDHVMALYLLSPGMNLLLAFLRVGLLLGLIAGVIRWQPGWPRVKTMLNKGTMSSVITTTTVISMMLTLALVAWPGTPAQADETLADFPPPPLLEELRQRLLEKSDCQPSCADYSRMEVSLSGDQLTILLKVHTAVRTAVPLPVNESAWRPSQVLLDNAPISGLARETDDQLWAVVPAGVHTIVVLGHTQHHDMVQLPIFLKPHMVTVTAPEWETRGLLPDGGVAASLQLIRLQSAPGTLPVSRATATFAPFFQVERHLQLGMTWQVTTHIRRLTPTGTPAVVSIPLLAGESITTPGIQLDQGRALVHLTADQRSETYTATLPLATQIEMTAPRGIPWVETWRLDAAPLWHCETRGIAPIRHQNPAGKWQPQWQPWPGESVAITISRPRAIAGQTKTIDQADLVLTPGRRFGTGELTMQMRTSHGGQHTLTLPQNANLQTVTRNGQQLPLRQEGQLLTLPLEPGHQTINVQWHQAVAFSALFQTPLINLGQEAVNARLTLRMPEGRWILFTSGPRWGPAVLFWSYLVVVALIAIALGRLAPTPLRTWQWLLLALGFTQIPPVMALIVVGWLIALGARKYFTLPTHWFAFNAVQLGLVLVTLAAFVCLFAAVQTGLVGQPEMNITGNDSTNLVLHWTADRVSQTLPQARVVNTSIWVYRGLMLAWSLWLAVALIRWLKWGWHCFATGALWQSIRIRKEKPAAEVK